MAHSPDTDANGAADGDEAADGADVPDPLAGMTAQQRKLFELKQKLRVGQKANQHAVIAERKREKVRVPRRSPCAAAPPPLSHMRAMSVTQGQH